MLKCRNKLKITINGVTFAILTESFETLEKIKKYFNEDVIIEKTRKTVNFYITVVENEVIVNKKYQGFEQDKSQILETFKNQIHYKYKNMYKIDNGEYICGYCNHNQITVYINEKNKMCKNILRIVRELLIRTLEDRNYFFMHGNGIKINGKGILILGNSGSGKTTFTSKINSTEIEQKFISNDRIFVNKQEMKYFPLPIVYAIGTAKSIDQINQFFKENNTYETRRNGNYLKAENNEKCDVPLLDISKIFSNVKNAPSSKIDLIVFPKISNEKNVKSAVLDKQKSITKLFECNFTPDDLEVFRKPWILKRKNSNKKIKRNKIKMVNFLAKHSVIIELQFRLDSSGEEIMKELVKYI